MLAFLHHTHQANLLPSFPLKQRQRQSNDAFISAEGKLRSLSVDFTIAPAAVCNELVRSVTFSDSNSFILTFSGKVYSNAYGSNTIRGGLGQEGYWREIFRDENKHRAAFEPVVMTTPLARDELIIQVSSRSHMTYLLSNIGNVYLSSTTCFICTTMKNVKQLIIGSVFTAFLTFEDKMYYDGGGYSKTLDAVASMTQSSMGCYFTTFSERLYFIAVYHRGPPIEVQGVHRRDTRLVFTQSLDSTNHVLLSATGRVYYGMNNKFREVTEVPEEIDVIRTHHRSIVLIAYSGAMYGLDVTRKIFERILPLQTVKKLVVWYYKLIFLTTDDKCYEQAVVGYQQIRYFHRLLPGEMAPVVLYDTEL